LSKKNIIGNCQLDNQWLRKKTKNWRKLRKQQPYFFSFHVTLLRVTQGRWPKTRMRELDLFMGNFISKSLKENVGVY
jgi:hypothetical protein